MDSYLKENEQISGSVLKEFSSFEPENIINWMDWLEYNSDIKDKNRELNDIRTEINNFLELNHHRKLFFMKDLDNLYGKLCDLIKSEKKLMELR